MFTSMGLLKLHAWTHGSLDVLFAHCAKLPFKLLTTAVPGFGYKTVRNQLVHIVETEHYWIGKLLEPDSPSSAYKNWHAGRFGSVAKIDEQRKLTSERTVAYLRSMKSAALSKPITLSWPDRNIRVERLPAFVVHHALTHAFHHKGQVVAMCRLLGYPAPDTDLQRD
jgi:uncharacterized damage-inducible protein DinB